MTNKSTASDVELTLAKTRKLKERISFRSAVSLSLVHSVSAARRRECIARTPRVTRGVVQVEKMNGPLFW
jgi:hypothetical protein|tara:strand:- start:174 stop:383 length:210 start_codon:yes stop_codon:yes gene_type:complete